MEAELFVFSFFFRMQNYNIYLFYFILDILRFCFSAVQSRTLGKTVAELRTIQCFEDQRRCCWRRTLNDISTLEISAFCVSYQRNGYKYSTVVYMSRLSYKLLPYMRYTQGKRKVASIMKTSECTRASECLTNFCFFYDRLI